MKSISRHTFTKLLAFILVVVFITAAVVQGAYVLFMEYNPETIMVDEFTQSRSEFRSLMNGAFHETYWLVEEDIISEEEIDTSTVPWRDSVAEETQAEDVIEEQATEEVQEAEIPIESTNEEIQVINEDKNYIFYVTNGKKTFTNREGYTKEDFAKYDNAFLAFENGNLTYGKNTNAPLYSWVDDKDVTMYIAFPNEFMEEEQKQWEAERAELLPIAKSFPVFVLGAIILIIYLTVVTGRKPEDEDLHLNWVDKIYTEFIVGGLILLIVGWLVAMAATLDYSYYGNGIGNLLNSGQRTAIYIFGGVTAILVPLCGIIYLALVRKFKGKRFIKDMLTYKFFHKIVSGTLDFFRSFFDGRRFEKYPLTKSLHQRQIVFIVASFILVFLTFVFIAVPPLMIIPPILEIVIIYWYVKYNNKTFEDINKGFNESLEEQMKSERMKINLVTNVSHDLKTPLTSIISYVDLLSKEDLSETARDYVNILMEKSNRLKNIVADLFDLAKSTSGAINVDFEELDLKKLIEQTLGDMGDDIEKSGLTIKTNFPEEPIMIKSDGKKLYRVFQNIVDNALKYSLLGTRIFVELEEKDNMAIATVKNTAGYEMDFTAEDILQRFNRGDESRTTDGSGLGLSIAESFTEVSGGNFKVDIDGDMFKVIIGFEKIK